LAKVEQQLDSFESDKLNNMFGVDESKYNEAELISLVNQMY